MRNDYYKVISILLIWIGLLSGCRKNSTSEPNCLPKKSNYNQINHHPSGTNPRFIIFQDQKWGFIDTKGKVAIEPQFGYVRVFKEDKAAFKDSNNKWGFIDTEGKVAIEPQFEEVSDFVDGQAAFQKNNKWGVINSRGQILFEKEFESLRPLGEQLYAFQKNNKWGVINSRGQIVIEAKFSDLGYFANDRAAFSIENENQKKTGFINPKGQIVFKHENIHLNYYDDIFVEQFNNDRLPVFAYSPGLSVIKDFFTERASCS